MKWPTVPLGELCDIKIGRTPSRSNPAYWGAGHPWLSIRDMNQGMSITETKEQITVAAAELMPEPVQPGTVLLSFKLSLGKVGIAKRLLYTNEAIAALPIKNSANLDEQYLAHALRAVDFDSDSNRAAMGSTLNKRSLSRLKIPLPPINEQHRVASVLDCAIRLCASQERSIALLDELRLSVFTGMFGPNGSAIKTGKMHTVGDIASFKSGKFLPASSQSGGPHPVFGGNGVNGYHSEYLHELPVIVIGRVGANCGAVHLTPPKAWVTDNALIGTTNHQAPHLIYLSDALKFADLNQYANRSGQPSISAKRIYSVPLLVPAKDQQELYAERVEAIAERTLTLQRAKRSIEDLLSSLQYRAFRGEL